jgi:hypothetical protein
MKLNLTPLSTVHPEERIFLQLIQKSPADYSTRKVISRSQWPRCLRRRSADELLLGSCVRIAPGSWMFVSCECLCCQVEVSATVRSLVQRSPTDCGVCLWSSENKQPQHLLWVGRRGKDYETKSRHCVQKIPPIMNPVHALPLCSVKIRFNIMFPSMLRGEV